MSPPNAYDATGVQTKRCLCVARSSNLSDTVSPPTWQRVGAIESPRHERSFTLNRGGCTTLRLPPLDEQIAFGESAGCIGCRSACDAGTSHRGRRSPSRASALRSGCLLETSHRTFPLKRRSARMSAECGKFWAALAANDAERIRKMVEQTPQLLKRDLGFHVRMLGGPAVAWKARWEIHAPWL